MQRRRFTEEFKREAVKLASQPGASAAAIASDQGINANLLGRWRRKRDESGGQSVTGNAASVSSLPTLRSICLYRPASPYLANAHDVPCRRGFHQRFL